MAVRKRLDPVKTRESIFDAALEQFSEKGYEGASLADVAQAAGVPKSLVQYHFGSKFGLWSATMGDRAKPMIAMIERAVEDRIRPSEMVRARFDMLRRSPKMSRIMTWLALETVPLPQPLEERLESIRRYANEEDALNLDLLLGMCALDGWLQNKSLYARVLGESLLTSEFEHRFSQYVFDALDRSTCEKQFLKAFAAFVAEES